jgi:hypothetical protein
MVGSVLLAYLTASHGNGVKLSRYVGFAGFGYALFIALFSMSRSVPLSMALIVPAGFSMTMLLIGSHAVVQSKTEDRMRGVVSTVFWMYSYFGMFAIGGPTLGFLVEQAGTTATICGAALACAVTTVWYVAGRSRNATGS